jgi:serine/threonine protein kinase
MLTTPDGPLFAKLIDFGLVQPSVPGATGSFGDDQSVDGARFLGTPLFASPEQLREEPMDVRTDLFSLGMTLWFLMEGRAPETGSSAEIAASRLDRESYAARLPANLPPRSPVQLLEKDRKNRFATAADGSLALNACAAALGFRWARDYTDPGAPEWEDMEATESGAGFQQDRAGRGGIGQPSARSSTRYPINEDSPPHHAAAVSKAGRRPRTFCIRCC